MKNLEMLRESRKWSRKQLAEMLGNDMTVRKLYSYEREGVNPDIDTLILLADIFGVSVDFLLGHSLEGAVIPARSAKDFDVTRFGERVCQFREAHGISKKFVAQEAGISTAYLSAVESGIRIPKLLTAVKILNALGVSADFSLMDTLNAALPQKASLLQSKIAALPPEKQRFVLNILESMIESIEKQ